VSILFLLDGVACIQVKLTDFNANDFPLCRVYTSATCCNKHHVARSKLLVARNKLRVACCAQHVASSNKCKRGIKVVQTRVLEQHGSRRSAAKLLYTHTYTRTYIQSRTLLNPASPAGGGIKTLFRIVFSDQTGVAQGPLKTPVDLVITMCY